MKYAISFVPLAGMTFLSFAEAGQQTTVIMLSLVLCTGLASLLFVIDC